VTILSFFSSFHALSSTLRATVQRYSGSWLQHDTYTSTPYVLHKHFLTVFAVQLICEYREYLSLVDVEVVDDDSNEEVESEKRAECDEHDEVQVHWRFVLQLRLLVRLQWRYRDK